MQCYGKYYALLIMIFNKDLINDNNRYNFPINVYL
jgi:hypothetical protein